MVKRVLCCLIVCLTSICHSQSYTYSDYVIKIEHEINAHLFGEGQRFYTAGELPYLNIDSINLVRKIAIRNKREFTIFKNYVRLMPGLKRVSIKIKDFNVNYLINSIPNVEFLSIHRSRKINSHDISQIMTLFKELKYLEFYDLRIDSLVIPSNSPVRGLKIANSRIKFFDSQVNLKSLHLKKVFPLSISNINTRTLEELILENQKLNSFPKELSAKKMLFQLKIRDNKKTLKLRAFYKGFEDLNYLEITGGLENVNSFDVQIFHDCKNSIQFFGM